MELTRERLVQWCDRALKVATAASLAPLVGLYSYWLRSWWYLGHPPRPYQPDPKDVPYDLHYWVTLFTILLDFALGPIVILLGTTRLFASARRPWWVLVAPVAWVLVLLLLRADPWRVGEWFFD